MRIRKHAVNLVLFGITCFLVSVGLLILFYVFTPLPTIDSLHGVQSKQSITIQDRHGDFLFDVHQNEQRRHVAYGDISPHIINATVALEDHLFFSHEGIRPMAFFRALIKNIQAGAFVQGGSTITQQVIKNVFLTGEKKVERKLKEFILAPKLEQELSKEEILEIYLNTVSYGGVLYGVGEAASSFFNKKPSEVTIAEAAYIASLPRAPSLLSPYGTNRKLLEFRKNHTLERMLEFGFITRNEYQEAREEQVYFHPQHSFSIRAPHFVFFVKEQLEKQYGGGLSDLEGQVVVTTLDYTLQDGVEQLIQTFAPTLEKRFGAKNTAAIILAAKTGDILAMVGSQDYFESTIDGGVNITTSLRQPGSTIKPFVYAQALERGFRPETLLFDVPTQFNPNCDEDRFETSKKDACYSPVNYDGSFRGPISIRDALAQSINIPAVKTLYLVGVQRVLDVLKKAGIHSFTKPASHYGLSLVLGGGEVTPLELANAYSSFANDGLFAPYRYLLTQPTLPKQVFSKEAARDINSILSDNNARAPVFGAHSPLYFEEHSVAAKTGTTNNSRDVWVVGYTPDIVVLIWGGNADGTPMEEDASGFSLSPLFHSITELAIQLYGSQRSVFEKNTTVPPVGNPVLGGFWNPEEPHSILHYIHKQDPLTLEPIHENDPQYSHWEYGVTEWADEYEKRKDAPSVPQTAPTGVFSIVFPASDTIHIEEPQTIIVTPPNRNVIRYEFYIDNILKRSSHLPHTTLTLPPTDSETVTIQVTAHTNSGMFLADRVYKVK